MIADLNYYSGSVEKKPSLSTANELALFTSYQKRRTKKSRDFIVRQYLHWAAELACRYCGPRFSKSEAISAANLGLMQAIESFDPTKGKRFVTHSFFSIRRTIVDSMRTESYLINPYPALNAQKYLCQKAGKTSEAKKRLKVAREGIFADAGNTVAIVQPTRLFAGVNNFSGGSTVPETELDAKTGEGHATHDGLENASMLEAIKNGLNVLTPQERKIVRLRYLGTDTLIFREIGEQMDIEEDHVRYIHDRAIVKLREHFKDEL